EDVPHRHVRVDILAQPDADRDLHLRRDLLDLRRGLHEVVVGRRAVLHPDLRPHFLVIVAGIGHPHVGQRELLLGERVVRRAMRELDLLAVLLLERGHDVGQIDDVLLERGTADGSASLPSSLRSDYGRRAKSKLSQEYHGLDTPPPRCLPSPPLIHGGLPMTTRREFLNLSLVATGAALAPSLAAAGGKATTKSLTTVRESSFIKAFD